MDSQIEICTALEEWALSTKGGKPVRPIVFEDLSEDAQKTIIFVYEHALANCSLDDIAKGLG